MAFLNVTELDGSPFFDDDIVERGLALKDQYASASPFPHIVIEDFLPPHVLDRVVSAFPARSAAEQAYERAQENLKTSYNPDTLRDAYSRCLFYGLNSRPFIQFLEGLTSIKNLLPDPYFEGGGLHETLRGGHLSVHADFNIHWGMRALRRLNLIIYLNKDWDESYGGHLELWEKNMSRRTHRISPVFNRAVIFTTNDDSFHGHPDPLTCPEGRARRSIAIYYYSASDSILREHRAHTTQFKARPGTEDRIDMKILAREAWYEVAPPFVARAVRKLMRPRSS